MRSGGQREKEQERDNVREGLRKDQVAREIHPSAKGIFLRGERIKFGSGWGNSCSVIAPTSDCRVILHRSYVHFPLEKNIPLAAP